MIKNEVIKLMESSKNAKEWDANCDKVKDAYDNNYPSWWYSEIITSGLVSRIAERFD